MKQGIFKKAALLMAASSWLMWTCNLGPVLTIRDSLSLWILDPSRCTICVSSPDIGINFHLSSHEYASHQIVLLMLLYERTFHSNDDSLRNVEML